MIPTHQSSRKASSPTRPEPSSASSPTNPSTPSKASRSASTETATGIDRATWFAKVLPGAHGIAASRDGHVETVQGVDMVAGDVTEARILHKQPIRLPGLPTSSFEDSGPIDCELHGCRDIDKTAACVARLPVLPLRTPNDRQVPIGLICTDMDRTLTDRRLRVVPAAMVALDRARKHGIRIVLATGRTPNELSRRGDFFRHFDAVVVEGGALYGEPHRLKPLSPRGHLIDQLAAWLEKQNIEHRRGAFAVSIPRHADRPARRFAKIKKFNLLPNRDRIDITLAGVDKGRALRRLVKEQFPDIQGRRLAFADGENDLALFAAAHYRVAVLNAVPQLKKKAHEVLDGYGGRAVARFLGTRLLPSRERR